MYRLVLCTFCQEKMQCALFLPHFRIFFLKWCKLHKNMLFFLVILCAVSYFPPYSVR